MTLIDGRMQFRVTPASEADSDKQGAVAFTWLDLAGEEEDSYLLVVEDQPNEKIAEFELTMYRCMWERDNNRDAKDAKKEELMAYGSAANTHRHVAQQLNGVHNRIEHSADPSAAPAKTTSASSSRQTSPKKPLFRAPSPSSSDDEVADELTSAISKLNVGSGAAQATATQATPAKKPSAAEKGKSPASASKMYPSQPLLESTPLPAARSAFSTPAKSPARANVVKSEPEPEPLPQEAASAIPSQADIANATRDPPDERQLMLSEECDINLFDAATALFMQQEANVVATLWLVRNQAYTCKLATY